MRLGVILAAAILVGLALNLARSQYTLIAGDATHKKRGVRLMYLLVLALVVLEVGERKFGYLGLHPTWVWWVHIPIASITFLWLTIIAWTGLVAYKNRNAQIHNFLHRYITQGRKVYYALWTTVLTGVWFLLASIL